MRRALLTATATAGSFSFGYPLAAGSTGVGNYLYIDVGATSPSAGTITTAKWYGVNTTPFTFLVGSVDTTAKTFTVRSSVNITPAGTGVQAATVSLAVAAGDVLAYWSADAAGSRPVASVASSGTPFGYLVTTSAPAPGSTVTYALSSGAYEALAAYAVA